MDQTKHLSWLTLVAIKQITQGNATSENGILSMLSMAIKCQKPSTSILHA